MKAFTTVLFCAAVALAAPHAKRQNACFIVGNEVLPQEVADIANGLANTITCDANKPTIDGVPDVSSNGQTFSSIDFATSGQSPLAFALDLFATADVVADSDLEAFQDALNAYIATEIGLRSKGGNLAIKAPKFFLQFQIARIERARGNDNGEVERQLEKVVQNANRQDQALLDEVRRLATVV
ncbi:hypothetical protein B0I35DRAFT_476077 [Stachybotrys elegans]|uniref:DUF7143 domain-containing protein n=1 Tax=Stachybotrys elegans TaxID=80388 RepID=A0A8K0SWV4_9HYPO|nr:hypothetical protein B0I35DRAFT_476077 [Stachybotrys elegans]